MNPETIDNDRSDNLIQRTSTQAIAGHLKRIRKLEEEASLELQRLHEAQRPLLTQLDLLKRERNHWLDALDWEGERLVRKSIADWDAAQEKEEDEKDKEEEAIKAAQALKDDIFDRNHLLGYFVRIYSYNRERKGIVTERYSFYGYSVILLDGKLESSDSRQFTVIQPTEEEKRTLRNFGYFGPFGNNGRVSLV